MNTYKIEKNVDKPKRHQRAKYPFAEMELDDSFEFPVSEIRRVQNAAAEHSRRHAHLKVKFSTRTISDKKGRCWRTR